MARIVDVHDAKARLSELIRAAEAGASVLISRRGRAVVRLVAVEQRRRSKFGMDRGLVQIAPDFDSLPEDVLREFEANR